MLSVVEAVPYWYDVLEEQGWYIVSPSILRKTYKNETTSDYFFLKYYVKEDKLKKIMDIEFENRLIFEEDRELIFTTKSNTIIQDFGINTYLAHKAYLEALIDKANLR